MRVLGITGPIAGGKSTVDAMLRDLGADPVIDADAVVHELYATSPTLQAAIAAAFGPEVRAADGAIDRRALGSRVFGDPAALQRLQEIVHPAVRAEVRARLEQARLERPRMERAHRQQAKHDTAPSVGVAVVDAVKLLEGELASLCAERWWIAADPAEQRRRLIQGRGLSPADAEARLAAQPRLEDWRHLIDRVIDNTGTLAATRRQVEVAWRALTEAQT